MRDGGNFHARVAVRQAVETSVITKRAFKYSAGAKWFAAVRMPTDGAAFSAHPTFDHDFRIRGHPQRHGLGADEGNAAPMQETAHQQFADARRQRGGGAVRHDAFAAKADSDRHALPEFLPTAPVRGAIVVHVPMHGKRCWPEQLAAVHADVVTGGARSVTVISMDGVHASKRDVAAGACGSASSARVDWISNRRGVAIKWPALEDGKAREIHFIALGEFHYFLARSAAHALGANLEKWCKLPCLGKKFARGAWWHRLGEACNARADR